MKGEPKIFKDLHQPLLSQRPLEDRHIDFGDVLAQGIVEDDFQKPLA
jgi:hypothetical protein